jgi:hypothetical protein
MLRHAGLVRTNISEERNFFGMLRRVALVITDVSEELT